VRITIIAPQYKFIGKYYELPLGLAYISSSLKKKGYEVEFINMNEEQIIRGDDYHKWAYEVVKRSDVLLTGGLSVHFAMVQFILDCAKGANPDIITIAGGGLISSEPELMLETLKLDYAVIGEGEKAVLDILQGGQEKIVKAGSIDNIDELPFPDYDGLKVENYLDRQLCGDEHYTYTENKPRCLPIISSRSCPYRCSFCYHPTGQKYRQRSIESFACEVEYLKTKYNVNMLAVLDELITVKPERLAEICKVMKEFNLKWMTQMRVSNITKDIMAMMKDAGCFQISFGIEHVDEKVLKSMRKKITKAEIENALSLAREAGIGIQGNILFGDVAETGESITKGLQWLRENEKYGINANLIVPYPGTKLYRDYVASKHIPDKLEYIRKGCQFIPHKNFNYSECYDIPKYIENKPPMASEVIYRKPTRVDKYKGQLYDMKIKCFHCKEEIEYRDLYQNATGGNMLWHGWYRIGCKKCNQRTDFKLQ